MLVHQKAASGNLKLEVGMAPHLPVPRGIEEWHWATQLNQAHAIRFGVEHFRSLTPHNTGVIMWQLNDDWPVVSWAAVDFDEHRKPLWHAMRDAYAPRLTTIQPRGGDLALVLVNDTPEPFAGTALLTRRTLAGAVLAATPLEVEVPVRGSITVVLPRETATIGDAAEEILVAGIDGFGRALHNGADVIAQRLDRDAAEASAVRTETGYRVTVRARSYLRDVFLAVDRLDPLARVDAGLVSLLAGETAVFEVASQASIEPQLFTREPVLVSANTLRS
jgi:beta-mannosidase